jgi:ribosome maturation factor RimP
VTATLRERLIALIEPLLGRLGYELVDLEYSAGRTNATVRLFIDKVSSSVAPPAAPVTVDLDAGDEPTEGGIGLDDCERVSREVSALLDVEDPIPMSYTLEVSSPGFDRVLRTQAHFGRFLGSRILVELKAPRDGRRRYTGTLLSVDEVGFALEVDKQKVDVPFAELAKARLAP